MARRASRFGRLSGGSVVLLGLLLVVGDLMDGRERVDACRSVATAPCLGGMDQHVLLVAGVALLVAGWRLGVSAEGDRPLGRALLVVALVGVPLVAMIAWLVGEDALNSADGAWDGRVVPIRLALLVVIPAVTTLALCALRRGRWLPTLSATLASAAFTCAAPFVFIFAVALLNDGQVGS